jgi:hypothetical protein
VKQPCKHAQDNFVAKHFFHLLGEYCRTFGWNGIIKFIIMFTCEINFIKKLQACNILIKTHYIELLKICIFQIKVNVLTFEINEKCMFVE